MIAHGKRQASDVMAPYQNPSVHIVVDNPDKLADLASDIFDATFEDQPFAPSDLFDQLESIRHYRHRTQLDILRAACNRLCAQSSPDNPLLMKRSHGRFQWDNRGQQNPDEQGPAR